MRPINKTVMYMVALLLTFAVFAGAQDQVGSLKVAVTTSSHGGTYKPRNCTVIWITDANGKFVKTIGLWAKGFRSMLDTWALSSVGKSSINGDDDGILKVGKNWDGTTAASRNNHGLVTGYWDLRDSLGNLVPPGKYRYHIEMTESNKQGPYAYGDIQIGSTNTSRTGVDSGNALCRACVSNVTVTYVSAGPDKTPPAISSIKATNQKTIQILFTEPVDSTLASTLANYTLTYKNTITDTSKVNTLKVNSLKYAPSTKTLTITSDSLFSEEMYTLEIRNLKDLAPTPNTAAIIKGTFEFQQIFSVDITESLPMVFDKNTGSGMGTVKSTFVVIPHNPVNFPWATIRANIEDMDDTLEASFFVNTSPAYYNASEGIAHDALAWGDVDVSNKFLINGINEIKVKFNNDLNGTTKGFTVHNLQLQYEIVALRKGGIVSTQKPTSHSKNQLIMGQGQIRFQLNSKENQTISIYNFQGIKVKDLPQGSLEWDYTNSSGVKVKEGVYMAIYQIGQLRESIPFTLLK